jgi:hypothetical protein
MVTINTVTGQLGSQAVPGGGITTINGNTSSVTGSTVTFTGQNSTGGYGQSVQFVGNGTTTMNFNLIDGGANFFAGSSATGSQITGGASNFLFGFQAAENLGSGAASNGNIVIGSQALRNSPNGSNNICLNASAGVNYSGGEDNNILLSNVGVNGESNTIRIGSDGSVLAAHTSCFIQGIAGVTVANSAAVLIDTTTGEMGTIASSRRFKKDIVDMEDTSRLLSLRPVNFVYKESKVNDKQYGLIAEEVEEIFPELIVHDKEGLASTVKYHDLPVLLLAELKKAFRRIEELEKKVG